VVFTDSFGRIVPHPYKALVDHTAPSDLAIRSGYFTPQWSLDLVEQALFLDLI
jgi:hypothetical protein